MRLKETGHVSQAAIAAGRPRNAFYRLRDRDPWFAKRWYESMNYYLQGGLHDREQTDAIRRAAMVFAKNLKRRYEKYATTPLE